MPSHFYVTTPIYYVNDVPHLGNAYSTIVADVLARYHRLRGQPTRFLTGTDEHGLKVERVAKEQGLSAQAFVDKMSEPFRQAWPKLTCNFDDFIRTTEPRHERGVAELWRRVNAAGDLYLGAYEGWYCVGCEAYYTEKELEPGNLCPLHKTPVERIREPTYFFRLKKYGQRLLDWYEKNPSFVAPPSRMNEVTSFVRSGLEDLSVSRTTFKWGVPVPDGEGHIMFVWFDALGNYWTAVQDPPALQRFWPPTVHIVGKDILRFHAVYWPAFLMSAGFSDDELPRQVYAHGFLTFNGQKMSKSLRNTVSPLALAEAFGTDTLRYYLMSAIAFGQDGDFNVRDLVAKYNADLGNSLGNLLNRVLSMCAKQFGGEVPPNRAWGELERDLRTALSDAARATEGGFDRVNPTHALQPIFVAVSSANAYIDKAAPWTAIKKNETARLGTILATALETLEAFSVMLWAVMPTKSDELRAQLGLAPIDPKVGEDLWPAFNEEPTVGILRNSRLSSGKPLGKPVPLFPRIDPEREAELLQGLGMGAVLQVEAPPLKSSPDAKVVQAKPSAEAPDPDGAPTLVAYDDFAKLDLRVGQVIAAERIPGKDKLLSLRVDLGEPAPRPIIAGLALSFRPEDLIGRRVVVVANLEPRKFGKGLESRGMILAAGASDALLLATVGGDAPPGTKVK